MKRDINHLAALTMLLCALLFMCCTQRLAAQAEVLAAQAEVLAAQAEVLTAQAGMLTLTKGKVTAMLDTFSGRFAAASADGKSLLFLSRTRPTSHISIAMDGTIWTNYGKSQMSAPYPQRNLGRGRAEVLADRLRYTWEVRAGGGTVRIIEELEPVSDLIYEEVRIHLIVENVGLRTINAGMTVMEDVDANGNDNVMLRQLITSYPRERSFTGVEIPERLVMMSDAFAPDSGHCRFLGQALSAPDIVTVGRWYYHSGLGTAVYGYTASGQQIGDAAVLLQWNSNAVPPGGRREEVTAIGFTAPLPEGERKSTFAREFIIPYYGVTAISIVSDSTAHVRISAPYIDGRFEDPAMRNGEWDTTVVVHPSTPINVFVALADVSRNEVDSITWYHQHLVKAESDADISIIVHPLGGLYNFDADCVLPVSEWGSEYLFHGAMTGLDAFVHNGGMETMIEFTPSIEFRLETYTSPHVDPPSVGHPWRMHLPPFSRFSFEKSNPPFYFNPWNPVKLNDRNLTNDGAGDPLLSSSQFLMTSWTNCRIWPGRGPDDNRLILPYWEDRYFHYPARHRLGTEYVFVPFRKSGTTAQEDFVRIIAYEDDTDITLYVGTTPMRLNRSDHVDTLINRATVIQSSKPVAVYQHHLTWSYFYTAPRFCGGAFALLPHGFWGKRYYSVEPDGFALSAQPFLGTNLDYQGLRYDNLYLTLVTKAMQLEGITINKVPVDPSSFTVFGEWAYAYVDIQPGYHIVEGDHPFLTISCGGGYSPLGRVHQPFGVSFIPPYR